MPLGSETPLRFSVTRSFPVRRSIAVESRDANLVFGKISQGAAAAFGSISLDGGCTGRQPDSA